MVSEFGWLCPSLKFGPQSLYTFFVSSVALGIEDLAVELGYTTVNHREDVSSSDFVIIEGLYSRYWASAQLQQQKHW